MYTSGGASLARRTKFQESNSLFRKAKGLHIHKQFIVSFYIIYILQGISHWSVQSKSALRGRRIHNCFELWCLVGSGGLEFWVSSTSFQKSNIGWPQQPLTESLSNISEKLDFWWSIPQNGTGIGHLGARDDQAIKISKFLDEMRLSRSLRPLRLLRPLRSLRLQRF